VLFERGVVYEGVSDKSMAFRGESGSNDGLIPSLDNLCEVTARLPANELTDTLREFRAYRPAAQRVYLEALEHRATEARIVEFSRGDKESQALYVLLLDQNREFRDR
jgi:indoleamine 2,3-dioxygenase